MSILVARFESLKRIEPRRRTLLPPRSDADIWLVLPPIMRVESTLFSTTVPARPVRGVVILSLDMVVDAVDMVLANAILISFLRVSNAQMLDMLKKHTKRMGMMNEMMNWNGECSLRRNFSELIAHVNRFVLVLTLALSSASSSNMSGEYELITIEINVTPNMNI